MYSEDYCMNTYLKLKMMDYIFSRNTNQTAATKSAVTIDAGKPLSFLPAREMAFCGLIFQVAQRMSSSFIIESKQKKTTSAL